MPTAHWTVWRAPGSGSWHEKLASSRGATRVKLADDAADGRRCGVDAEAVGLALLREADAVTCALNRRVLGALDERGDGHRDGGREAGVDEGGWCGEHDRRHAVRLCALCNCDGMVGDARAAVVEVGPAGASWRAARSARARSPSARPRRHAVAVAHRSAQWRQGIGPAVAVAHRSAQRRQGIGPEPVVVIRGAGR